jgi:hypothetical protein
MRVNGEQTEQTECPKEQQIKVKSGGIKAPHQFFAIQRTRHSSVNVLQKIAILLSLFLNETGQTAEMSKKWKELS